MFDPLLMIKAFIISGDNQVDIIIIMHFIEYYFVNKSYKRLSTIIVTVLETKRKFRKKAGCFEVK